MLIPEKSPFGTRSKWLPALLLLITFAIARAASAETFDPVEATDKFLNSVPADAHAKSDAYFEGGYYLLVWDLLASLIIAWGLLKFGVTVKLRNIAERFLKWRFFQGVLFFVLFILITTILNLPWNYYEGFIREHKYGLSNLTTPGWLGEQLKGLVLSMIFFSLLGSLLYLAIRKWPRRWWVLASVFAPVILFLAVVITPVFVAPVFNTYKKLENPAVRDPILSMARANGVPADNVYEFDASKQTSKISANVSGAFGTIRVSLNDNLLTRSSRAEIQAVMGHELGHYVMNHVYKLVIYMSLVTIAMFAFTQWFMVVCNRRFGAKWGLRGIDDFAALPVLMAGFAIFGFLATPIQNSITRTTEAEADIFGLNAARQPDGFAAAALKLGEYRKLSPGPLEEIIFFDHPSGHNRILMAMRWKAEHLGEFGSTATETKN